MKTYTPSFYGSFVCLAGACPDSCCTKWEIPVDENTSHFFHHCEDDFSGNIRAAIVNDAQGDEIFRLENGRCPFLNQDNLCEIRIRYGQEHTCDVCRQYPDFVEEYGDFTEVCPSLSCPAMPQLILSDDAAYPVHSTSDLDEWLQLLLGMRNAFLMKKTERYMDYVTDCVNRVYRAENLFSECGDDSISFEINEETFCFSPEEFLEYYDEITALLCRLEILTPTWDEITKKGYEAEESFVFDCLKHLPSTAVYAFRYVLFRYFLKAVNGYSASAITRLCAFIIPVFFVYSCLTEIPFEEILRLASKEIEHNPDNIGAFADFFL